MKIGILGTGIVGTTIGSKLVELGHEVKMGSRTKGNEKAAEWVKSTRSNRASQGTFYDAAHFGEIVFNCTNGANSLEAIRQAGVENLRGKILVDVANPLDFSKGMPPTLSICNTDSLGEKIQSEFPEARVVKTLNTMNCKIMVNPKLVPGEHDVFVCGNDFEAKTRISGILKNWFGWTDVIDLGDISGARATEMILPLWVRLLGKYQNPNYNFKIVKGF
jgi:predicted dinucleotide-binding enzyme